MVWCGIVRFGIEVGLRTMKRAGVCVCIWCMRPEGGVGCHVTVSRVQSLYSTDYVWMYGTARPLPPFPSLLVSKSDPINEYIKVYFWESPDSNSRPEGGERGGGEGDELFRSFVLVVGRD